jgi:hypothetical protein
MGGSSVPKRAGKKRSTAEAAPPRASSDALAAEPAWEHGTAFQARAATGWLLACCTYAGAHAVCMPCGGGAAQEATFDVEAFLSRVVRGALDTEQPAQPSDSNAFEQLAPLTQELQRCARHSAPRRALLSVLPR